MTIDEFLEDIKRLKHKFLLKAKIEEIYKRIDKISLRILLRQDLFIAVYYNTQSKRMDFSLINHESRVFGYDNAGGWHYHPVEDPESHKECEEPSLEEMFQKTAQIISKG